MKSTLSLSYFKVLSGFGRVDRIPRPATTASISVERPHPPARRGRGTDLVVARDVARTPRSSGPSSKPRFILIDGGGAYRPPILQQRQRRCLRHFCRRVICLRPCCRRCCLSRAFRQQWEKGCERGGVY